MLGNSNYNADAYDATCRVCEDWTVENVAPSIAAMQLMTHSDHHDTKEIGGPWWALRVVDGFQGTDPEHPDRTVDDGWNRSPTLTNPTTPVR